MNRRLQKFMMACYGIGFITLAISRILRNQLTDFTLGFLEGLSFVFIVIGFIYVCWSFIRKRNPYKFQ